MADDVTSSFVEHLGIRIPIDPSVMSEKMRHAVQTGRYDQDRAARMVQMLEPGDRVVDLGAGLGFISAFIARLGRAETVVAIEGDPNIIPLIQALHRMNDVSCVVRNALVVPSRTADTAPFYVHHDLWASSLLPLKARNLKEIIQVPVLTFAEVINEYAPTILMIDFEVLRELVPSIASPQVDVMGQIDFRAVPKVQLMLKPKEMGLDGVKRAFDVLSSQGFAYDAVHSVGNIVLMRRIDS